MWTLKVSPMRLIRAMPCLALGLGSNSIAAACMPASTETGMAPAMSGIAHDVPGRFA